VGERGASVTFGKRGTRTTVGLPGTGLSYTQIQGKSQIEQMNQPGSRNESAPSSPSSLRWVLIACLLLAFVALAIFRK
jgi:hypothetical protein